LLCEDIEDIVQTLFQWEKSNNEMTHINVNYIMLNLNANRTNLVCSTSVYMILCKSVWW